MATVTFRRVVLLFCLLCALERTEAAKCVVSKWTEWSKCYGNCDMAQRVRNRDVYRPPFPERRANGDIHFRECPPLYEVVDCLPKGCKKPKVHVSTTTLSPVQREFNEDPGNLVNFFPF
uniref:Thrombospondin type-1 domain-containing protein 4 n=1 Tax=Steinernema glaseri TaxID=37863 RepID=A0A1I7YCR6_9BILA